MSQLFLPPHTTLVHLELEFFVFVSKTISLLSGVLTGDTKAVALKGSLHDMTSSAFDCSEISTCV